MTTARALMVQGCGSNVGKSLLVTALCRVYARKGMQVAPFKPQNMSNNAAVGLRPEAIGGGWGEFARAQALQARAAKVEATTDMNPLLLKPEADGGSLVVVSGKATARMAAQDWLAQRSQWREEVLAAFARLADRHDLILVEGAGSPAETNLRNGDLANMGFAEAVNIPVVLVGDIESGGVIAQMVGTHLLLSDSERKRTVGFFVNKFRGDRSLFDGGRAEIVRRTGWQDLGLLPWCSAARALPPEDSLALDSFTPADFASAVSVSSVEGQIAKGKTIRVVVPRLPSLANADDLDGLRYQDGVSLRVTPVEKGFAESADMILLPGSKSVRQDLEALRLGGGAEEITAFAKNGGAVVGLCGGYQMLGQEIADPDGIEGKAGTSQGLGLLPVATTLRKEKSVRLAQGQECESGLEVQGYEIHTGETRYLESDVTPFLALQAVGKDGAVHTSRRVFGCYLHGLFQNDAFRVAFLNRLFPEAQLPLVNFAERLDANLNAVADFIEQHCDCDALLALAESPRLESWV